MYIPFSDLAFEARIWIYQANRALTNEEVGTLTETLKSALDTWDAHGNPLTASGKIFENRFVVIGVDERDELPSGCSIDKSTNWFKELGHQMNIDFFNRSLAYYAADGSIQTMPLSQIKQAVANEVITPSTIVFDQQVATKAQWMKRWKVSASDTWLKKYFEEQSNA